jgi:hypothetical protein
MTRTDADAAFNAAVKRYQARCEAERKYTTWDHSTVAERGMFADTIAEAILAAVAEERERCAGIADAAARLATSGPPLVYIIAQQFAADLAKDIADGVRQGLPAPERQPEPKLL